MLKRGGSVNPANFPDETFELLSIPAFDKGEPEIVEGKAIGSLKSCVQPNDVLLSKIVPHIKRCWVVPARQGTYRQIGSGEWIIFRSDKVHPPFLKHFLTSDLFHKQFMNTTAGVGGSLVRARPAEVGNIEVPLPPLPEQKRIAVILDKADAIRRKRQQATQLADDFLRAVFLEMFGDPVTNSMGWKLLPFSTVGTLDRGKSRHRPRNDAALLDGAHPLIQTGEVANSRGYITEYSATYSDLGLAQSKKWDAGTLCITIAANIAKTGILTFPACFPDSVVGFIPNKNATVEFVQHWLGFLQKNLEANAPQAAQKNINLEILRGLLIPVPPIATQEKFSAVVTSILAVEGKIASSSCELRSAFDALCQKAFSGRL
nr:restriction endonuclease subunit S [Pseudomonas viridiflava]